MTLDLTVKVIEIPGPTAATNPASNIAKPHPGTTTAAATGPVFNGEVTITIGLPSHQPKCQNLGDAARQLGLCGRGKAGRKALRNLARGR